MNRRNDELERFKREINLVEYAEACGFEVDRKRSTKASVLMRRGGEKIVVATDQADGHGIWFDVGGQGGGSVIDLAQREVGGNLGHVRKELRGWVLAPRKPAPKRRPPAERPQKPEPSPRDRAAVLAAWQLLEPYSGDYLSNRRLDPAVVAKFGVRQDARGNACMPHYDAQGVTGWEAKKPGFSGFSAGGQRSLGMGRLDADPIRYIVVCESGIDAMSYAQLYHRAGDAYASLGGALGPHQVEQLVAAAKRYGAALVIGTDADQAGDDMAERLLAAAEAAGVPAQRDRPPAPHRGWNDVLRANGGDPFDDKARQAVRPRSS